jgi:glycosyltransferase involved in cell wall biosynthesis
VDDEPGATCSCADVDGFARALHRVRRRDRAALADACRSRISRFDFASATAGLLRACELVARLSGVPRVVACCGNMVTVTGLERMTFTVLGALRDRGARVHCMVNNWENHRITPLAGEIGATWSEAGHDVPFRRRGLTPAAVVAMMRDIHTASAALWRSARRMRATHILLPDHLAPVRSLPSLVRLRRRGVQVIMRLGNAPDHGRFYRWYWRSVVDPMVDTFVCNSDFTAAQLQALGIAPHKTTRIYNVVPQRSNSLSQGLPPDPNRVLYVGQVIPGKGLDLLLEAMALLVQQGSLATLTVVGDLDGWTTGEYREFRDAIRRRVERADLAGRVGLLGWRDDVPALMASAAVHCAPSRPEMREGFGVVNLEAKQAAIPSVTFACGAYPEIITHGVDGWICPEVSPRALADGLNHFLGDAERRRRAGAAARESLHRFAPETFSESWWTVFSDRDSAAMPAPDAHVNVRGTGEVLQ